jgi:hypothetical protein
VENAGVKLDARLFKRLVIVSRYCEVLGENERLSLGVFEGRIVAKAES